MKYFWDEAVEKIETHILYTIIFFSENRAVCEIMWKDMAEWDMAEWDMAEWDMAEWDMPQMTF